MIYHQTIAQADFRGPEGIPVDALMTLREARSEAVSADGGVIACLETATGLPQIWLREADGSGARRITDLPERVVQIAFAPVGRDLLFTTDVGMDERYQLWLVPGASGTPRPLTADPCTVHVWGAWSPCGTRIAYSANDRDPYVMDICLMEIATGAVQRLREGTGHQEVVAWTADGATLIVRDTTRGSEDQDLLRVDVASGAAEPAVARLGRTIYGPVRLRKDGTGAWVLSDRGGDFRAVQALDFASAQMEPVIAVPAREIDAFALNAAQDAMAVVVNEDGFSRLCLADPATGALTTVALPFAGLVPSLRFLADGGLLMTIEGPARPAEIWRCDPASGAFTQVTRSDTGGFDLAPLTLPAVERFASFDGTDVPYFVYPPQGERPAEGWPVIFFVHGGPTAQWQAAFRPEFHHYMSRGIMVIAPNVRGSTGYGRAYHEADDREKRMDAVQDLIALAESIAARPNVDAARIGLMGPSYGGFMTLAALSQAPHLWKTGVDIYGISNFATFMETTGPWRRAQRAAEYGDPERDADLLVRISPVHALQNVAAPLLVVHATDDPRVPMEQGEQVYSRLRGLGKPAAMLRIDHEGHGFSRVENRRKVYARIADWVGRTL